MGGIVSLLGDVAAAKKVVYRTPDVLLVKPRKQVRLTLLWCRNNECVVPPTPQRVSKAALRQLVVLALLIIPTQHHVTGTASSLVVARSLFDNRLTVSAILWSAHRRSGLQWWSSCWGVMQHWPRFAPTPPCCCWARPRCTAGERRHNMALISTRRVVGVNERPAGAHTLRLMRSDVPRELGANGSIRCRKHTPLKETNAHYSPVNALRCAA